MSIIKDIFSVAVSKGLIIVFGLITSVVVARVLGPEKNGIISVLLVYPSLFMTVGSLGIRQSTTFFLGKKIFSEEDIKATITQIWILSSLMCMIVCLCLMKYVSQSVDNMLLITLAIIPIPFALFNTYNSGIFLGKNQIGSFNKINWIPKLMILLCTVLLILVFSIDITGYMIALITGPLFIFIILLFRNKFIKSFRLKVNWPILKRMLGLGLSYSIALLIIDLNYRLDVIILDNMSTPYEIGLYSKGVAVTQYLWQIPMVLSPVIFTRSAISKNEKAFSLKVASLLRISLIIISLASIVLFVFSDWVILLLFGEEFQGSTSVLNILLLGVILLTVFKVMNMDLAGKGKPWISMKAMIPALIINIVLNVIWIPTKGADGAALASTISYSSAALLFLFFYSREVEIPMRTILLFQRKDFDFLNRIMKKKIGNENVS
jgi:O-antigen/teichoic acid export membrane protein